MILIQRRKGEDMAKTIYEKSTRALLKDMIADTGLKPGQVITATRVLQWFNERYPKLKVNSLRAHLVQAATNDRGRLHHPSTNTTDDLLFKVAPGQYRLFEPGRDPAPIHEFMEGDVAQEEQLSPTMEEDVETDAVPGSSEFLLEKVLQRYLAENLDTVEQGLRLYEEDGIKGIEFANVQARGTYH